MSIATQPQSIGAIKNRKSSFQTIQPGKTITLTYPATDDIDQTAYLERLRVRIEGVRDLVADPLSTDEFLEDPFVVLSRWMITGFVNGSTVCRRFSLGASREFASPSSLRLAVYEPDAVRPSQWIGPQFGQSSSIRKMMVDLIHYWNGGDHGEDHLRVVACDVRLILPDTSAGVGP